jgi:hypothetical protein
MAGAVTRRAIEWPRMILGVTMMVAGFMFFQRIGGDSHIGPALSLFGLALAVIACLGRGCNRCGKVMRYREFGFSPQRADEVTSVTCSEDPAKIAALLASPRIGDLDKPRTSLMVFYCPRCKQVAELTAGELGPGFRTRAEIVIVGPAAQQIGETVRKTKKKR